MTALVCVGSGAVQSLDCVPLISSVAPQAAPPNQLSFPYHTLSVGQDVAVWYKQDAEGGTGRSESVAFIGRVRSLRLRVRKGGSRSSVVLPGPVSLQKRLPGIVLQCAWYSELEHDEAWDQAGHPLFDIARRGPVYGRGAPTLEDGAWILFEY